MDSFVLAHIGLSRLRLPIPTVKLSVVRHAARLLETSECQDEVWEALLKWISELEFESEVVEALTIPLLARSSRVISTPRLRQAITKPSLLSDLLMNEIAGSPTLINTWIKAHSVEVPPLFSGNELIAELAAGRVIPPILSNRLKRLEEDSGKPFLRQWAFECQRLFDTYGEQHHGYWDYFVDSERDRNTGQFITRRGHVARSSYLRTLALAVDVWGMPETLAFDAARYTSPVDLCFLPMEPGIAPEWAETFLAKTPSTEEQWKSLMLAVNDRLMQDSGHSLLVHLNSPVALTKNYKAEIEVITYLHDAESFPEPELPWNLHHWLLANLELERTTDWAIRIAHRGELLLPTEAGKNLAPGLLPAVGRHIGYMHSDLFGRIPYLPANYSRQRVLMAKPRAGGMDVILDGEQIGVVEHWNYRWSPTHDKALGPHCGISVRMTPASIEQVLSIPRMKLIRCWRAKVLAREKDYGEFEEIVFTGFLP